MALAPACPDRAMAGWGRRFRIAIQGRDPRTQKAVHLAHVPGAARRRRVSGGRRLARRRRVAGRRRHQVRQPRGGRGALSAVLRAPTNSGRDRAATGSIAAARAACWRWWSRPTNRRSANTAGDGVVHGACGMLGGKDGVPHRYVLHSGGAAAARAEDQGGRHRDPPRRSCSASSRAAAAAGAIRPSAIPRRGNGMRSMDSSETYSDGCRQAVLPLPLREGVRGRGQRRLPGPLPPTPSRKGRGSIPRCAALPC